jgi:hypothetical protein
MRLKTEIKLIPASEDEICKRLRLRRDVGILFREGALMQTPGRLALSLPGH